MPETTYQLVLYAMPGEIKQADATGLASLLETLHFIGNPLDKDLYLVGDHFLDHLTFMGCSPNIALTPEDGDNFCTIKIFGDDNVIVLHAGKNTQAPFCKTCHQTRTDWPQVLKPNYCDQCGLDERANNHVWKKTAALARAAIVIAPVYPGEAVPSAPLLDSLESQTGVSWRYAYI